MAAELLGLEALNILDAVDNAATELQELWAIAHPPPPLELALADIPALGELSLVEMFRAHAQLLQLLRTRALNLAEPRFEEGAEGVRRKVRNLLGVKKIRPHIGGP
jgi:hypothetical protein